MLDPSPPLRRQHIRKNFMLENFVEIIIAPQDIVQISGGVTILSLFIS